MHVNTGLSTFIKVWCDVEHITLFPYGDSVLILRQACECFLELATTSRTLLGASQPAKPERPLSMRSYRKHIGKDIISVIKRRRAAISTYYEAAEQKGK